MIWDKTTEVSTPSWDKSTDVSTPSWDKVAKVTTPNWNKAENVILTEDYEFLTQENSGYLIYEGY